MSGDRSAAPDAALISSTQCCAVQSIDPFAGPGIPLPGVDPSVVTAGRHENTLGPGYLDGVDGGWEIAEALGEMCAEGHRDEIPDGAEVLDPDPGDATHGAARPVGADDVPRRDPVDHRGRLVADRRQYGIAGVDQIDQLDTEPDPAADAVQVLQQHGFEMILRAAARRARALRQCLLIRRVAEGHGERRFVEQCPGEGHHRSNPHRPGPDLLLDSPGAEELHRPGADSGRLRERRGAAVFFHQEHVDAVPGQGDRRGEPGRPGPDDEHVTPVGCTLVSRDVVHGSLLRWMCGDTQRRANSGLADPCRIPG